MMFRVSLMMISWWLNDYSTSQTGFFWSRGRFVENPWEIHHDLPENTKWSRTGPSGTSKKCRQCPREKIGKKTRKVDVFFFNGWNKKSICECDMMWTLDTRSCLIHMDMKKNQTKIQSHPRGIDPRLNQGLDRFHALLWQWYDQP